MLARKIDHDKKLYIHGVTLAGNKIYSSRNPQIPTRPCDLIFCSFGRVTVSKLAGIESEMNNGDGRVSPPAGINLEMNGAG